MLKLMHQRPWALTLSLMLAWAMAVRPSLSQTKPSPSSTAISKTDQLLRQASETLKAAPSFSFQADISIDSVKSTGQKLQYSAISNVIVRRPDRLWAEVNGDRRTLRFYYDGTNFAVLNPDTQLYATLAAPRTIDALVDTLAEGYGLVFPLADLVYSDPYKSFTGQVKQSSYIGLHNVNGQKCHHLAFRQEVIDWQIWVREDSKPLFCKLVITYKQEPGLPQYTAVFSQWDLDPPTLEDHQFTFKAPPNAKKIDFLPTAADIQPLRQE